MLLCAFSSLTEKITCQIQKFVLQSFQISHFTYHIFQRALINSGHYIAVQGGLSIDKSIDYNQNLPANLKEEYLLLI